MRIVPEVRFDDVSVPKEVFGRLLDLSRFDDELLSHSLFCVDRSWSEIRNTALLSVLENFISKKRIGSIEENRVRFTDGSEEFYDRLFWCAKSDRLRDIAKVSPFFGSKTQLLPIQNSSAIEIVRSPFPTPSKKFSSFEFRFKEHKSLVFQIYRRLSVEGEEYFQSTFATIPLSVSNDPEEQAKFIRAMKREIVTNDAAKLLRRGPDRIIHHRRSPAVQSQDLKSHEIAKNLFYCSEDFSPASKPRWARNFEIALHNAQLALESAGVW